MVAYIDPQVIGHHRIMVDKNKVGVELALTGYAMFRKDRRERREGGVILFIE